MEGVADFLPLPTLVMSGLSKKKNLHSVSWLTRGRLTKRRGGKRTASAARSCHAKTGRRGFLRRKPNDVSKATPS